MSDLAAARIRIGPCGWSYPDWNGVVYPVRKPRGFKPLAYLARFFNALEVNASFYAIPTPRMTSAWPRQVPADFRFTFKLTRDFTHERDEIPSNSLARTFIDGISPVRQAGLLGPLLIQFPWSFRYTAGAVERLERLADYFSVLDRSIEVRHASWAQPAALETLRRLGGYCNIDQPRLRNCLPPTEHVFGPTAYVRLHGRNAANWFAENQPAFERYNYLYDEPELREWASRLNTIRDRAEEVYVFTNNHYRGQAVANALELRAMLESRPVEVPANLLATYPRLARIATPPREPGLFDNVT